MDYLSAAEMAAARSPPGTAQADVLNPGVHEQPLVVP